MKWCGKSAPRFGQLKRQGKPHSVQDQIGTRLRVTRSRVRVRSLEHFGNKMPREMASTLKKEQNPAYCPLLILKGKTMHHIEISELLKEQIQKQLEYTLKETNFCSLGSKYSGKVRDVYKLGEKSIFITTDRLSAFDHVLTTIPFKGHVLNELSLFWYDYTKDIVKNPVLERLGSNTIISLQCKPIPIEVIIRGYITGSLWREYQKGKNNYEISLPDGLKEFEKFPKPIFTPSTKAEPGEHDAPISEQEIISRNLLTKSQLAHIKETAFSLFEAGQKHAENHGLLLVDTKYEFGYIKNTLYLIDEVHTPDSSRFWYRDSYLDRISHGQAPKMFDKENIRRWLLEHGYSGDGHAPHIPDNERILLAAAYIQLYEKILDRKFPFEKSSGDVLFKVKEALVKARYKID